MIIKGLFELIYSLLSLVLTPFQIVPSLPSSFSTVLNRFFDFIFEPIGLLLFFVDINFIMVLIPLVVVVANMEKVWNGILWILKKLPFLDIS